MEIAHTFPIIYDPFLRKNIIILTIFDGEQRVFWFKRSSLTWSFFKFTSFIILLNNKSENNERHCFRSGLSELLRVLRSRQTAEVQLSRPTAAEKRVSHLIVEMWDCMKWIGTVVFSHKSGWELFSARCGSSETFGMTQGEKLPREETKRGGMGLKTSLF